MNNNQETEKADVEKAEVQKWRKMVIEQLPRIINTEDLECVYYFTKRMADLQ